MTWTYNLLNLTFLIANESWIKFCVNNLTRQVGGLTSQRIRSERRRIQICENRHRLYVRNTIKNGMKPSMGTLRNIVAGI